MKSKIFPIILCFTTVWHLANSQQITAQNNKNELESLTRNYLPDQFSKSNFTLDDAKKLLYKKCKKAALDPDKPQTYENIEIAATKLMQCANNIGNVTILLAEIESARPVGDLDVVFHKYCTKLPQAEQCLQDFNEQLLPCLTAAERAQNAIMMRIISALLSFVCYKNGSQIALFISEEGPECLAENRENISNCMNATYSAYLNENGQFANNEIPELVMGPKQCIDLHDFEECVLSFVEKCNEITPANIVESLFRYVKNETKCQAEIDKVIRFHPANVEMRNAGVSAVLGWTVYLATFLIVLSVFLKNYFEV